MLAVLIVAAVTTTATAALYWAVRKGLLKERLSWDLNQELNKGQGNPAGEEQEYSPKGKNKVGISRYIRISNSEGGGALNKERQAQTGKQ